MAFQELRFTPEQMQAIRSALKGYGSLARAAAMAGVSLSRLRASISRNEDLAAEVDDLLAEHAARIYEEAMRRALGSEERPGSDMLLAKLLEAKVEGFAKETRVKPDTGRPTSLRLRTFDSEGAEKPAADDVEIKPRPTQTLAISMQRSL
jgi:hypothetical protein